MIGVIDYGAGNIYSVQSTLDRLGLKYGMIQSKADYAAGQSDRFDRFIIPGVGHAGAAMRQLELSGMAEEIPTIQKPVLGICVGMQLMTQYSEEGDSQLLGLIPLDTLHFKGRIDLKTPHMGWNQVMPDKTSPLFEDVAEDAYFYFVHSYYIPFQAGLTSAYTDYGVRFSAAFERDNFYGVQFHPEKSGAAGEQVLLNFAKI